MKVVVASTIYYTRIFTAAMQCACTVRFLSCPVLSYIFSLLTRQCANEVIVRKYGILSFFKRNILCKLKHTSTLCMIKLVTIFRLFESTYVYISGNVWAYILCVIIACHILNRLKSKKVTSKA